MKFCPIGPWTSHEFDTDLAWTVIILVYSWEPVESVTQSYIALLVLPGDGRSLEYSHQHHTCFPLPTMNARRGLKARPGTRCQIFSQWFCSVKARTGLYTFSSNAHLCVNVHTSATPQSILVSPQSSGCVREKKTRYSELNCKNSSLQSSSVSPLDNPCQRRAERANNLLSSIAASPEQREKSASIIVTLCQTASQHGILLPSFHFSLCGKLYIMSAWLDTSTISLSELTVVMFLS